MFGLLSSVFAFSAMAYGIYIAYKYQVHGERVRVPSVFILKQLENTRLQKTKIKFPPRFFIDVLILLLLLSFILSMAFQDKKYLIIIDNSLSTNATMKDDKSRIEMIKKRAIDFVQSNAGQYQVVSLPSFENSHVDSSWQSRNTAIKTIRAVEALEKTLSINSLLQKYVGREAFNQIHIVSDKELDIPKSDIKITKEKVWEPKANLYFADKPVIQNEVIEVYVAYSGPGSTRAVIELYKRELSDLQWQLIKKQRLSIPNESRVKVDLNLKNSLVANGAAYKLQLKDFLSEDSLSEDNVQYVVTGTESDKLPNLFVSNFDSQKQIKSMRSLLSDLQVINFEEYTKGVEANEKCSSAVFYKVPAPEILTCPSLLILPTESSDYLTIDKVFQNGTITSWATRNSLLQYVETSVEQNISGVTFLPAPWGNSIIETQSGEVFLAGVYDQNRLLVSGIDLLPLTLESPSPIDVFTVNAVRDLEQFSVKETSIEIDPEMRCVDSSTGCRRRGEPGLYLHNTTFIENKRSLPAESKTYLQEEEKLSLQSEVINSEADDGKGNQILLLVALGILILEMIFLSISRKELIISASRRSK